MDADIAQRMQAAIRGASHQQRAGCGVEPEIASVAVEPGLVVDGDPPAQEDLIALGGKHVRAMQQLRVGHDRTSAAQPLADRGNALRKVHLGNSLILFDCACRLNPTR